MSFKKVISYVGILVGIILIGNTVQAETIHFKTDSDLIKNSKIKIGWKHVGFVDDLLDLADGDHRIRIDAPHNYTLRFNLTVKGNDIKTTEKGFYPNDCVPELKVSWPDPTVENSKIYKNVTSIVLPKPIFGKPTGINGCPLYSMMGCDKKKVILTASSEPQGAEIWIDGKKMLFGTDNTLSVPYCDYQKTKMVLVRMPGMVNCLKSIPLSPNSRVSLACVFNNPEI